MIINEIKTELSKMSSFYGELTQYVEVYIKKINASDSAIDSTPLKELVKHLSSLKDNLNYVISSMDDSKSDELFSNLTKSFEKNIESLNPLERTTLGDEILGYLDKGLEIHEVQSEQFSSIKSLIEMCSPNH